MDSLTPRDSAWVSPPPAGIKPRPIPPPAEAVPAKRDEYILACFLIFALYLSYTLGGFLGEGRSSLSPSTFTATRPPIVFAEAARYEGAYVRAIYLRIEPGCLRRASGAVTAGVAAGCRDLGTAQLEDGTRATIMADTRDAGSVWLALYDGNAELRGGRLKLAALQNVNDDWFGLRLQGSRDNLFVTASVGEGAVSHHRHDAEGWHEFDVWKSVKDRFPDLIEPAFDVELRTDGDLTVTERDGVGGPTHTESSKERTTTRIQYVFRRVTNEAGTPFYEVASVGTIPR